MLLGWDDLRQRPVCSSERCRLVSCLRSRGVVDDDARCLVADRYAPSLAVLVLCAAVCYVPRIVYVRLNAYMQVGDV